MNNRLPNPWLLAAGGLALAVGIVFWVIMPLADGITTRKERLAHTLRVEAEAIQLADSLRQAQSQPAGPTRPAGFTIFSFVENAATKEGVKSHVEFMRPANRDLGGGRRETAVNLRLSGLSMQQLLAFLQRLETAGQGVHVRQLILRPSPKGGLDADLAVAVVLRQGG